MNCSNLGQGIDISSATKQDGRSGDLAESNVAADRDEDFNTRYGSYRCGQTAAIKRVKPIPRDTAQVNLSRTVLDGHLTDTSQVVDHMIHRFMRVPPGEDARQRMIAFLNTQSGTAEVSVAQTYLWTQATI